MTCSRSRQLLALEVEGDLELQLREPLDRHLESCGACREHRAELIGSQAALKAIMTEEVDAAALEEVRRRVLRALEEPRAVAWAAWLRPASALALLLLIVVGAALWVREAPRPEERAAVPPPETASAAPEVDRGRTRPELPPRPAPAPRSARATRLPKPVKGPPPKARPATEQPVALVKLLTNDPDVIIYWLIDQPAGAEAGRGGAAP